MLSFDLTLPFLYNSFRFPCMQGAKSNDYENGSKSDLHIKLGAQKKMPYDFSKILIHGTAFLDQFDIFPSLQPLCLFMSFITFQDSNFCPDDHDTISCEKSTACDFVRNQTSSQKAISLPSSPHRFRFQDSERGGEVDLLGRPNTITTYNRVLESSKIPNQPLLPFKEWNIDFSELTVGSRVGIGTHYSS